MPSGMRTLTTCPASLVMKGAYVPCAVPSKVQLLMKLTVGLRMRRLLLVDGVDVRHFAGEGRVLHRGHADPDHRHPPALGQLMKSATRCAYMTFHCGEVYGTSGGPGKS